MHDENVERGMLLHNENKQNSGGSNSGLEFVSNIYVR